MEGGVRFGGPQNGWLSCWFPLKPNQRRLSRKKTPIWTTIVRAQARTSIYKTEPKRSVGAVALWLLAWRGNNWLSTQSQTLGVPFASLDFPFTLYKKRSQANFGAPKVANETSIFGPQKRGTPKRAYFSDSVPCLWSSPQKKDV